MRMPVSASIPSCTGGRHDHSHLSLPRLGAGVHPTLAQPAPISPQNSTRHPCLPHWRNRHQPLSRPQRWPTPPTRSCLRQSTWSAVSTPHNPTLAPPPTRQAATRAALPHHLHRTRTSQAFVPLVSRAGLPHLVSGLVRGPQKTGKGCALPRRRPARLSWYPAYVGQATPVASPHA